VLLGGAQLLEPGIDHGVGRDFLLEGDGLVRHRHFEDLDDGLEHRLVEILLGIPQLLVGLLEERPEAGVEAGTAGRAHRIEDVGDDVVPLIARGIEIGPAVAGERLERPPEREEIHLRPRALAVGDRVHRDDEPADEILGPEPLAEDRMGREIAQQAADRVVTLVELDRQASQILGFLACDLVGVGLLRGGRRLRGLRAFPFS